MVTLSWITLVGRNKWQLRKQLSIHRTGCNSLWNKKKKKRILNQILLSKLWCIVQINTIPIFIKQKSKKQCKISSGTKIYNSPWEEAQLSIWKCGLGISDIDTQSNSLELKWIQRLLNHANAFRKGLTLCLLIWKLYSNQDLATFSLDKNRFIGLLDA